MKTKVIRLLSATALVALTGCTEFYEPTPTITKIDDAWIISGTAALSDTFVRTPRSTIITCSEPPPDSAFNQADSADINLSIIAVGGSGDKTSDGAAESSEETELAGRTPGVLLSRELFFRACEFSQNYKLSKDEALTLYNKTLDIVDKNWAVEAGQTTVTIGDKVTTSQSNAVTGSSVQSENASSSDATTSSSTTDSSTDDDSSDTE